MTEAYGTKDARATDFDYDQTATGAVIPPYLTAIFDPRAESTTVDYQTAVNGATDGSGTVSSGQEPIGRRALTLTDRASQPTRFAYGQASESNENYDTAQVTDPRGFVTSYRLDRHARPVRMTDARGSEIDLAWDSDQNGNTDHELVSLTQAAGSSDEAKTTYAYNQNGRLTSQTDPNGHTTTLAYRDGRDAGGPYRWHYAYSPDDQLTALSDPRGHQSGQPLAPVNLGR